jgi:ribonuclease HII
MSLVVGVDEAGRGAVIGPLVIAGVLIEENDQALQHLGVKDSKLLTPKKRRELSEKIKDTALKYTYFDLSPAQIDRVVLFGEKLRRLNYLEMCAMAKIIRDLRPDRAIVDPSDVKTERCVQEIRRMLPFNMEIVCEHHADRIYPVVSAASILAKVRRDAAVSELRERYGDFGSGYPSDPKTIGFLERIIKDKEGSPVFVRSSWATIKRLREP